MTQSKTAEEILLETTFEFDFTNETVVKAMHSFARQEKRKLLEELMEEIKPIWHNQPPGAARHIIRSKLNQLNE